jgi:HSP20 family molecular chaperone IbpA
MDFFGTPVFLAPRRTPLGFACGPSSGCGYAPMCRPAAAFGYSTAPLCSAGQCRPVYRRVIRPTVVAPASEDPIERLLALTLGSVLPARERRVRPAGSSLCRSGACAEGTSAQCCPAPQEQRVSRRSDAGPVATARHSQALAFLDAGDRYELTAALPGVKAEDIKLTVEDGILSLHAEQNLERVRESEDGSVRYREHRVSTISRRLPVPEDAVVDSANAELTDGTLRLTLRKTERPASQVHVVPVVSSSTEASTLSATSSDAVEAASPETSTTSMPQSVTEPSAAEAATSFAAAAGVPHVVEEEDDVDEEIDMDEAASVHSA